MKRYKHLTILCMAFFLLLFSACGAGAENKTGSSPVTCDALEAVKAVNAGDIESITYTRYTEGGALSGTVTDAETIENIYLRLCQLKPGRESDIRALDDSTSLNVDLGSETLSFYFEGFNISVGDKQYEAENLGSLIGYINNLISAGADSAPITEPQSAGAEYQAWQHYDGCSYYNEDGQLKYRIEFGDQFRLHCMFRSGEPEYHEEVYTLYPDLDAPTAQQLSIRTVLDGSGDDISDRFESLVFLFSTEDTVLMQVKRDERTLAGGTDGSILTGEYLMKPRESSAKTPEQLCVMAQEYYSRNFGFYPPEADCADNRDGTYTIHLYEIVSLGQTDTHTATSAWYTVDAFGVGTNDITGEPVDLSD